MAALQVSKGFAVSLGSRPLTLEGDLIFDRGDTVAVLGANGQGKTTFFNCISGLTNYSGTIMLPTSSSQDLNDVDALYSRDFLYDNISYRNNIRIFASEKVRENEALLSVNNFGSQRVEKLSEGQRKLAAVTILAKRDAPLVLLDEVSNGLDHEGRLKCSNYISSKSKDGTIFLLTGHNLSFFDEIVNRVITIHDGNITDRSELLTRGLKVEDIYAKYCT